MFVFLPKLFHSRTQIRTGDQKLNFLTEVLGEQLFSIITSLLNLLDKRFP